MPTPPPPKPDESRCEPGLRRAKSERIVDPAEMMGLLIGPLRWGPPAVSGLAMMLPNDDVERLSFRGSAAAASFLCFCLRLMHTQTRIAMRIAAIRPPAIPPAMAAVEDPPDELLVVVGCGASDVAETGSGETVADAVGVVVVGLPVAVSSEVTAVVEVDAGVVSIGAAFWFASFLHFVSESHEYPNGQQVLVPQRPRAAFRAVVLMRLVGDFEASCCDKSHVMGCILSQFAPSGQQRAVVFPARALHVCPFGQQKLSGSPSGQLEKSVGHVSARSKRARNGIADAEVVAHIAATRKARRGLRNLAIAVSCVPVCSFFDRIQSVVLLNM